MTRTNRRRSPRPTVEPLEARQLLYATLGDLWKAPIPRVTYSIMPDGTSIAGTPSNLNADFPSGWLAQVQRAAAQWEDAARINIVYHPYDDGAPLGSDGYQAGDPSFGDIRIGGYGQDYSVLGYAFSPPPANGGTDAGDFFFNTNQVWQTNGSAYDVQSVALHEIGHAIGLAHSSDSAAAMYPTYHTLVSQELAADDIAGAQAIYGTWTPDPYEGSANNNASTRATDITPFIDGNLQVTLPDANNSAGSDNDWYKVTVPAGTVGLMVVTVQSTSLSSLVPALTVYNSSFGSMGSVTGTQYGDTITVIVGGVTAGQTFYIKEGPGTSGPGHTGSYGLLVGFSGANLIPISPSPTVIPAQMDSGGGSNSLDPGPDVLAAPPAHGPVAKAHAAKAHAAKAHPKAPARHVALPHPIAPAHRHFARA